MDALTNMLFSGDSAVMWLGVMVFLAVAVPAFGVMAGVHARTVVKRRAASIPGGGFGEDGGGTLRQSSMKAAKRLLDRTTKHYSSVENNDTKALRRRLIQAGIFDPRAVGTFFVLRFALAIGCAAAVFVLLPMLVENGSNSFWMFVGAAGVLGYLGPSFYLDKLIGVRRQEYRSGFPDFMDLLVVCADAGLAMEAALERVGRELADSYPALAANIHMTNLEIRAGRTMSEALEHFGDRLGLEEVRAFATLIQQSDELGSSITDALRVYSDDMRHKRLSRAEEKAYSLPAKLALPMMLCIFPVLFVAILLPVFVRIKMGAY
jgi:tight adherence protein C